MPKRKSPNPVDLAKSVTVELTLGQAVWVAWRLATLQQKELLRSYVGGEKPKDETLFRQVLAAFEKADGLPAARAWINQLDQNAAMKAKKARRKR